MLKATKTLKATLKAEYPDISFSVRLGRENAWIGQEILVTYTGNSPLGIHGLIRVWESLNYGYQVMVTAAPSPRDCTCNFGQGVHYC